VAAGAGVVAGAFGASGSLSGPFWPQPASAIAPVKAAAMAMARIIPAL